MAIDKNSTSKAKRRDINREELRRYLSENNRVRQIIDNIEKIEDLNNELDAITVNRLKIATEQRLALLKKYLPDEKSVEVKNADGETFKTDNKWTIEVTEAK